MKLLMFIFKRTYYRLFMDGYREYITGADLVLASDSNPLYHAPYNEGKKAAAEDLRKRQKSPLNREPQVVGPVRDPDLS